MNYAAYLTNPALRAKGDDFVESLIDKLAHDIMMFCDAAVEEGVPREIFAGMAAKSIMAISYSLLYAMEPPPGMIDIFTKQAQKAGLKLAGKADS